ncbi:hypothetical protein CPB84DRAFT_1767644 [Gymnopilus junonius]|uniref:DUF6699 domain-containing protein n=1 Tax=Gymnopilus junonius TaxID=109634 RepID=A0A9P5TQN5_GYMJU|nr:hypothetical protein CPB84DRAFT_1767644 [Gymnopilus junonius]
MPASFGPGWQSYANPYSSTPYYAPPTSPWSPNTPLWTPRAPSSSPPRHPYATFGPGPGWQVPPPSPPVPRPVASSKYPNLNPMLAVDTSILRYDLRSDPSVFAFPLAVDIKPAEGNHITCFDVWKGLFESLHQPIVDSEWGFIANQNQNGALDRVEAAKKKRQEADRNSPGHPLRIDYLGDLTQFRGLEKDDDYAKKRYLPSHQAPKCDENWMVKLTT